MDSDGQCRTSVEAIMELIFDLANWRKWACCGLYTSDKVQA